MENILSRSVIILVSILFLANGQQYQTPQYPNPNNRLSNYPQSQQQRPQFPQSQLQQSQPYQTPYNTLGNDGAQKGFYDQSSTNNLGRNTYSYSTFNNALDDIDENHYCPEHWKAFRQKCYRFIKSPKRNWFDAKKICRAYNAELINIDTTEKHSYILKELILNNQKQNRYYISARQLAPNSYVNDDNSKFLYIEDAFSYEDYNLFTDNQYDRNLENRLNQNEHQLNRDQNFPGFRNNNLGKDRLVYGFSRQMDRWVFMPAYDFENNLFICESAQLYSIDNINLLADEKRPFDYGMEVIDFEKIPRGPYFVMQPRDTTYDTSHSGVANDVTLSCLAAGFPTPIYAWYREEFINDNLTFIKIDPLADNRYTVSGGNLIITDPRQAEHQAVYHCVAENSFGRIRSNSAKLTFGFIMEFNLKRSGEIGEMNWGKSIFCDPPQHYPSVKYYWSRDVYLTFVEEDQRVFVSYDGALYFSYLEAIDRARYSCTVQSMVSNMGRNGPFFTLSVNPNSQSQELIFANTFPKMFPDAPIAGKEIRLECIAFGYPVPSYNWTRRDGPLPHHAHQRNYNRVLIIPNATINDNGEYICTIENKYSRLTKTILLSIQMEPNFTIPLRDKIKDYNSEVNFVCEAAAIPDVNYTWYKNADVMEIEKLNRDRYVIQDNVLTIKNLDPDKDDGMYQCRAENQLKAVYSSAQLRVLSMKPSFKKSPLESEIYAIYNGNTTIVCDPEAAPRPRFQWKKDGTVIGSGGHRRILPTGTLIISPTSRDDEGIYTCVATNANGVDESRARLIVLQELRFTQTLPPRILTQIHGSIFMQCEVTHDEILDVAFMWKYNGQPIKEELDSRVTINVNTLNIQNVTLLDAGDYECIAKSAVNHISSKTKVIVEGPPGEPGGVSVIEIQKTTAVIEWVDGTDNGRRILYYNILGRTTWNKTWVNVSTQVQAHEVDRYTSRQQAEVTNLSPWSGYEFSVCAVNELGIGKSSAPSPLYTTQEDKPYISPRNVGGGGGKIGDLTITWESLLPQEQNSHGIRYVLYWRLHGKVIEWSSMETTGNADRAVVNIPMDNYYTKYDVKAKARNNIGDGPESDVVVIYSAEDMPQLAPQQPLARSLNSTALNVTWQPVDQSRETMRGKLIGHRLKYWKSTLKEEDAVYYLSRSTRPWALVVGLDPDTYYFVKVMAYNAAGEGPESERYLERTYKKAPQKPPSSVHVIGVNPSTIRVTWRYVAPTQEEEPIQGYKVRVWEIEQDMSTANDTIILVGNNLETYVDTLTPGKTYKMRVLAFSNGGDGRMSSPTLHFQMGNTIARNAANYYKLDKLTIVFLLIIFYISKRALKI